ncbi:ABC transporter substrate-binding protein [Reyranella soli]|uniref:ABC transporter substrate-binding protein n=1 Tax=Reyranella soli TaxID=1230389 RepID=A0A512NIC5_9HYPH|nr:ABC transporter substrate-binding protein [Reyranella soli]GEP58707.1 ABC transporter substrate-binding protein [Reyranella soli]
MKTVTRLLLFLAMLAGVALPAHAQQPALQPGADPALAQQADPALVKMVPADVAGKPFTVAIALGSPPDDFRNEKGEIVGWEIDILRAATQSLGLGLELRPTTFDTLIPGLQAKRFDAATGQMGVTVVRLKVIDMVGMLTSNELFAAYADSPIQVKTLDDLCGITVATTRGSREMVFAEEHQSKCAAAGKKPINALAFNDGNGAAEAMMSRRADLFWLGSTAVSYFIAQSKGRTKIVGSYTDTSYIGVALPKGSPMAPLLQAAIQHLIDNGTYTKIVTKWGLEKGAIKHAPLNPTNVEK